jgi:hypothetical protein
MMSVTSDSRTPGGGWQAAGTDVVVSPAGDRDPAGMLLARLTVAPTLAASAYLLVSFPLLAIGWFRPAPVTVLAVLAVALISPLGLRALPGLRPGSAADLRLWAQPGDPPQDGRDPRRTPRWTVAGVLLIAAGFFAFQAAYHSQFLFISRDPASYMQFAAWISGHGSLPVQVSLPAFGGAKGVTFTGFGIYQVGNTVVPQFMAGLPMTLAAGFWAGGVNGALLLGPLLGALAVLVFGGLAARLLGARWAPLAALVLAVSEPLMFTSRSTYSEPLALVEFLGGLSLVIDSLRCAPDIAAAAADRTRRLPAGLRGPAAWRDSARVLALLGGLALGMTLLVRIDSAADAVPVIPFAGLLLLRRQPQAAPVITGMAIGWAWGWYDAVFISRPYVFGPPPGGNGGSTKPLLAVVAAALAVTAAGVLWLRRRMRVTGALPQLGRHWYLPRQLPAAAAILPFAVLAVFAARPHLQPGYVKADYVQLALHWVYWYLGGPAIALAAAGAAVLSRGCLRGRQPAWALPLMVFGWGITLFLYRPAIAPDQPWASRRLVVIAGPGFILLALWAVAWACGRLRRGEAPRAARVGVLAGWLTGSRRGVTAAWLATACAALLLIPAWLGASGTALQRTYTGQVAAIYGLCSQLPANASVLFVDGPMADRWSQTIRGMCGVPVARFPDNPQVYKDPLAPAALVTAAVAGVERAGRRPVLIAATQKELGPFSSAGPITRAANVKTTSDGKFLYSAPSGIQHQTITAWMWQPAR